MLSSMDEEKWQTAEQVWAQLYQRKAAARETISLVELDDFRTGESRYIYADRGALPYLKETIQMCIRDRKYAGSCTYCAASCNDNHGKNYNANMKNAMLKSKY